MYLPDSFSGTVIIVLFDIDHFVIVLLKCPKAVLSSVYGKLNCTCCLLSGLFSVKCLIYRS